MKNLVRGPEAKALTRTVIEAVCDKLDVVVRDKRKVGSFRKILSDEAIGIFVRTSLPGRIRIGKEEIGT